MGKSVAVELDKNLKKSADKQKKARKENKGLAPVSDTTTSTSASEDAEDRSQKFCKWSTVNNTDYTPIGASTDELPPGLYEINTSETVGIYFTRLNISCENILRLPGSRTDEIVKDLTTFWEREQVFKDYGLTHKRGALLFGNPGTSKSCTIKLVISDVIKRGGIALNFCEPNLFSKGLRILRDVNKNVPIVCIMEDIDALIETYDESTIINILDGVTRIEKIIFLASTNYVERLGARICNRPSRFDRRYKFDYPTPQARKIYFRHLFNKGDIEKYNIDEWVENTEGMSLAHLRELFVSVVILGNTYEDALETLKAMAEEVSSGMENEGSVGFSTDN